MLQMKPGNARALEGLALAHAGSGDYRKALELLDEAERINPLLEGLKTNRALVVRMAATRQPP